MPWSTSNRRQRLPKDWAKRVAATKARAQDRCEADQHDRRCDGTGAECDHHIPGDDHRLSNLRWLNHYCHQAKTLREAAAGKPSRKRPGRRHPGLR